VSSATAIEPVARITRTPFEGGGAIMTGSSTSDAIGGTSVPATFNIETLDDAIGPRRRSLGLPLSMGLHVLALAVLITVPALMTADLPEAHAAAHAFFVEPASSVPVPPPPPPPAPKAAARSTQPRPRADNAFVAPIQTPTTVPDQGIDLGIENGVPGGVEGGVEGGVVGGIVGGLPDAPAPPAPLRVGVEVRAPKKIKDVPPEYPELARRAQMSGVVIVEAVIGPDGHVQDATVLRGVPMLDSAAVTAVRQWVYTPTLLRGVPVPIVMTVTVTFNLGRAS
jgi:periplasmic protein TonB